MKHAAVVMAALGVLSLAAWSFAQGPFKTPDPFNVLSGADIGFQFQRREGNRAVGRLMVRVDGQWLEAQVLTSQRVVPLQTK